MAADDSLPARRVCSHCLRPVPHMPQLLACDTCRADFPHLADCTEPGTPQCIAGCMNETAAPTTKES